MRGSTPGPLVLAGSEQVAADFAQAGPSWLVLTEAGVAEVGVPSSSSVEAGAVQSGTTAGDPHEPSRYGGTVSKWWRSTGGRLHWVPYGPSGSKTWSEQLWVVGAKEERVWRAEEQVPGVTW